MTDWINETLGVKPMREVQLDVFNTMVGTLRADEYHDVEIYHVLLGLYEDMKFWPLWEYWCEVFLDWEDEPEGI